MEDQYCLLLTRCQEAALSRSLARADRPAQSPRMTQDTFEYRARFLSGPSHRSGHAVRSERTRVRWTPWTARLAPTTVARVPQGRPALDRPSTGVAIPDAAAPDASRPLRARAVTAL